MASMNYYKNMYSVSEAAKYLGLSYQTVLKHIKNGTLSAVDLSSGTRAIWGITEGNLIDFEGRKKKIRETSNKTRGKAISKGKEKNDRSAYLECARDLIKLKSKIKELSEDLLELSIKLDELSK